MSFSSKLAACGILLIACAVAYFSWSFRQLNISPEPFVSEHWKEMASASEGSNDPGCYRRAMALDLVESKALLGEGAEKIRVLLGAPERQFSGQWSYLVGQCSNDWGHSQLVVSFDANGKAERIELLRES